MIPSLESYYSDHIPQSKRPTKSDSKFVNNLVKVHFHNQEIYNFGNLNIFVYKKKCTAISRCNVNNPSDVKGDCYNSVQKLQYILM